MPTTSPELSEAVRSWTGGRPVRWNGVDLEIPELVENGHDVPLRVAVTDPGAETLPVRLAIWAPRNPQALVLQARFPVAAPRVELVTRIRLASTQRVFALAECADGRILGAETSVLVALAACIEG